MKISNIHWISFLPFVQSVALLGVKPLIISILFTPFFLNNLNRGHIFYIIFSFLFPCVFIIFSAFTPNKAYHNLEAYGLLFMYIGLSWCFLNYDQNKKSAEKVVTAVNYLLALSLFGYVLALVDFVNTYTLWTTSTSRNDLINSIAAFGFLGKGMVFPRYAGFFLDPNRWAAFLFIYLFYLSLFREVNSRHQVAFVLLLIVLTQSRAALLGTFIFIFIITYFKIYKCFIKSILIKLFIFPSGIFIVYLFAFFTFPGRFDFTSDLTNDRGRAMVWKFYIDYVFQEGAWLFGNGIEIISDKYYILGPHNTFIYIGFSLGLVGAMLFLILSLLIAFHIGSMNRKVFKKRFLWAGVIGFLPILCLEDYFFTPHLWVFFAILASVLTRRPDRKTLSIYQ